MQDAGGYERVTVAEAAEALGISKEAVRKRINRETLRADKGPDGTVRVYIPSSPTLSGTAASTAGPRDALLEAYGARIEDLRAQLEAERAANRENRRIIAGLVERMPPQLEAGERERPQGAPDGPENAEGGVDRGAVPQEAQPPPQRRSWWREFFGIGE